MKYLIKNGRLIDPANKIDETCDVFIADGLIEKVGKNLNMKADEVIDASNMIVAPGLVDMHTHLREPGREDEETVRSATRAAVKGGFTSVACMPNTEPAIDDTAAVNMLKAVIKKDAICSVFIIGAITEDRLGRRLTDFKAMKKADVAGISDDGASVADPKIMIEALEKAKKESLLIIEHCEDASISASGVMNKGFTATKMGLRGIPKEAEYEMVKRDIMLAKKAESRIHIAHISCKESVDIARRAKRDGVKVTAETAPHYFALTEECCVTYDTNMKMNPPLRTKEDAAAIKAGIADGTIDAIATDHAPHTDSEKDVEFDFAPFGVTGLETALSVSYMELIEKKVISWSDLISRMSLGPARILGIDRGNLGKGKIADIVIIDPAAEWVYKRESIESKSANSPFINWSLKAQPVYVFVGGRIVVRESELV